MCMPRHVCGDQRITCGSSLLLGVRTEVIRLSGKCVYPQSQTIILTPKTSGRSPHLTEMLTELLRQNHATRKKPSNWVLGLQVQLLPDSPASSLGPPALQENTRLLLEEGELDRTAVAPALHGVSRRRRCGGQITTAGAGRSDPQPLQPCPTRPPAPGSGRPGRGILTFGSLRRGRPRSVGCWES